MTDGGLPLETLDLFLLGIFAVVSLGLLVPVHYSPSARLERLERDYGLDRWSVWICCVVIVFAMTAVVAGGQPSEGVNRFRTRRIAGAAAPVLTTGVLMVGRAIASIRTARRLGDLERTRIGELLPTTASGTADNREHEQSEADGRSQLVALEGTAVSTDGTVEAPFTGTEALVFESTVFEPKDDYGDPAADAVDEDDWRAAGLFAEHVPFAIDDGTGRVRVEPADATFELRRVETIEVAGDEQAPERIESLFLETQALNGTTRSRRYEEDALVPGAQVAVVGHLEDGVVSSSAGSSSRWRSAPFLVGTPSLPALEDEYRYRVGGGVLGLCMSAVGLLMLLYGFKIL
ncbi:GIDE domain-containing protein [Halopiger aswanensis]|uniref:RING-type E3 ubiquitin transferase n=1 Tax=Halopiger aswanensis TaxID=148449 RepID=A0A419VYJ4_9EURY|nr:GIDE domain-containing protein [Halopiger aswanensis]RKD88140.1 E3 ubiquitin ligase [Halopiger aswanensis]